MVEDQDAILFQQACSAAKESRVILFEIGRCLE
jgi:hypothetical protein